MEGRNKGRKRKEMASENNVGEERKYFLKVYISYWREVLIFSAFCPS
jgi:hypothetical protein